MLWLPAVLVVTMGAAMVAARRCPRLVSGDQHPAFGWLVPPATPAVLGDDLAGSRDSRRFGPLAAAAVGHVLHHFLVRSHASAGRSGADAGLGPVLTADHR